MNIKEIDQLVEQKSLRKSVVAGSIGVLVHWFDWAVYGHHCHSIFPLG